MRMLNEQKVMRDPIHGYIHVDLQVVWDCINAKEMQRLRRIHQLGGDYFVYHTAEHSRFAHSLGVYEIVRRMLEEVQSLSDYVSAYEKMAVMLAGLLHDLGHGPFSHAFEEISKKRHEEYTVSMILDETGDIYQALVKEHPRLPQDVVSIIQYRYKKECLNQLISGQLDADRMDYLLRDAYFTGTDYGRFDLKRIMRTMRLHDGKIVVKDSGMQSVEDYVMARYHMYWQVYLHPVARSYEKILVALFRRMKTVYQTDPQLLQEVKMFHPFLKEEVADQTALFRLDDCATLYGFSCLQENEDPIIADLAKRLVNRKLFVYETIKDNKQVEDIKHRVSKQGYDLTYYVHVDMISQRPYAPYSGKNEKDAVWILKEDGIVIALEDASVIVQALIHAKVRKDQKIFYPESL